MAITYNTGTYDYGHADLTLNVTTGDLIVAVGCSSSAVGTLTFSGGGTWVHRTAFAGANRYWRIGYVLATTGSGNTTFSVANEAGDFAWHIHAYHWSGGSFVSEEGDENSFENIYYSGTGLAHLTGDLCFGGWVDTGNAGQTGYDHSFVEKTAATSHYSRTAILLALSDATHDFSGTIGSNGTRGAWQAIFRESGGAPTGPAEEYEQTIRGKNKRRPILISEAFGIYSIAAIINNPTLPRKRFLNPLRWFK